MNQRLLILSLASLSMLLAVAACPAAVDEPEAAGATHARADAGRGGGKAGGGRTGGGRSEGGQGAGTAESGSSRASIARTPFDGHFGINGVHYPPLRGGLEKIHARSRELEELGPIWLRHPGRDTGWHEIQSRRGGPYEWSKLDAIINETEYPWVMEIYGAVGTIYPFREKMSRDELDKSGDKRDVYKKVKENSINFDDTTERADAETYVKDFVTRYKDRIKVWEVGNEGINSPDRFVTIKHTYGWVKEADPEALVMITSVAGTDDKQFQSGIDKMDEMLEQGIGDYFDIGNFHYYGVIGSDFEGQLEGAYDAYAGVLAKHGHSKPIWVTETATSSVVDSELSGPSSEATQARHVVKRMVVFSAKGAEKVMWHGYRSDSENNRFHGCNLRDPRSQATKPSFRTLKLVIDKIGYYESVQTVMNEGTFLYRFTNPDGSVVLVAWSHEPVKLDLSEHLGTRSAVVTHTIEDSTATPFSERVEADRVSISASPIFVEAG